jgi:hypothetical protein
MRKINDSFYRLKINILNQVNQGAEAGKLRINRVFEEATWRLNETEAELQQIALGYGSRTFVSAYGQRRPNQSNLSDSQYLASLPIEHQGNPHKTVWDSFTHYDYPVSEYLRQQERLTWLYANYRYRWWTGKYHRIK